MGIRETRRIAAAAQACAVALMAVFAFALGTLPAWLELVAVCERLGTDTMAPRAAPGDSPQGEGRRSGQCATSCWWRRRSPPCGGEMRPVLASATRRKNEGWLRRRVVRTALVRPGTTGCNK
jgi:hypothetical protein